MVDESRALAITGATGFIGRHVLERLQSLGLTPRVLSRTRHAGAGGQWYVGDLLDHESMRRFLPRGGTLVHLAYSGALATAQLGTQASIGELCAEAGVRHLIHCSTVAVVGSTHVAVVNEETPCHPESDYERTKWAIEERVRAAASSGLTVSVIRPTAVFGKGGESLVKLVRSLRSERLAPFIRSTLFGSRAINLVPVSTVVNGIMKLIDADPRFTGRTLLISHDDDPLNNFRDVERIVMEELGIRYPIPPLPLPRFAVTALLTAARRAHGQPFRKFVSTNSEWDACIRTESLEAAIRSYVRGLAIPHRAQFA